MPDPQLTAHYVLQYDHNVEEDELILAKREGLSPRNRLAVQQRRLSKLVLERQAKLQLQNRYSYTATATGTDADADADTDAGTDKYTDKCAGTYRYRYR